MSSLLDDFNKALRTLHRNPLFATTVALVLGLGMAACILVFTAVNALVLRPLPFADPDRLTLLWSVDPSRTETRVPVSYPDYLDWRERTQAFVDLAAIRRTTRNAALGGSAARATLLVATPNTLSLLGITPAMGRGFAMDDTASAAPATVLLSWGFWQRAFGGDPTAIGRSIRLDGVEHAITGVLPREFERPGFISADLWTPLRPAAGVLLSRAERSYLVIGRLGPLTEPDRAATELNAVARNLSAEHPQTNAGWGARLVPLRSLTRGDRSVLGALTAVVVLLLLLACINLAALLHARATRRLRETAIRLALGASRWRIVQHSLVENVVLAVLAAGTGLVLTEGGLQLLRAVAGRTTPVLNELGLDRDAVGFAFLLALLTPLLFGLAPVLRALRRASGEWIRGGTSGLVRVRARRKAVVPLQLAMTMLILGLTSLFIRTVLALGAIQPGFDADRVLTARIELPEARYTSPAELSRFTAEVLATVRQLPGITAAATTSHLPIADRETTVRTVVQGESALPEGAWVARTFVTPEFLKAFSIPLLSGRDLGESDRSGTAAVALVNSTMARRYWGDRDPVGARLRLGSNDADSTWIEVVGVAGDVRNSDADQPTLPQIYLAAAQQPQRAFALVLRTAGDPLSAADLVRKSIQEMDADLAVYDVRTMRQVVFDDLASGWLISGLFGAFGMVSLVLALTGIYGMVAWSVAHRTPEIGLRIALGAAPRDIAHQFLREAIVPLGTGIGVGLLTALGAAQLVRSTLYGVGPTDPVTFIAVPVLLGIAVLAAAYWPARRALRIQPLEALRYE